MVAPATAAIAVPPGYAAPGIPQPAAKGAGGPHLVPSSGSTEAALRSQESSPGKPLPPKTPAPTHLDAAPPPPSSQWPPSALTQALRRGGSGGGAVPLQEPWGRPEHAGTAANGTAAAVSGREGHAVSEDEEEAMLHDDVLLFNAPAVGSGVPDPQLLVHSPDSSLAADDGLLAAADAARSSGPASPTTSSLEVQQQREAGGGAPAPAAAAAAGCAGSADGDGDGERTPRQSSALHSMPGALDVLSPGAEPGFSLAEMLQGPTLPPPRAPDMARSPGSRPAFLPDLPHLSQLDDGMGGLSPRRSLHLPGCSPLGLTGLRDPPNMPGMPPLVPRPPLLPPSALAGVPPPLKGPPGAPRPLPGHVPPGGLRRPLLQPMGRALPLAGPPPPLGLVRPPPLMRPPPAGQLPMPPHHHGMPGGGPALRPPLGAGMARPAGGLPPPPAPPMMVPVPVPAGGREEGGEWAPLEDELLTAEGVRCVATVPRELIQQQQQQQQQRQQPAAAAGPGPGAAMQQQQSSKPPSGLSGGMAAPSGGTPVPVQPVAAIRAPAANAAFAAIKAEAAAGAAAATAAILAAPTTTARGPAPAGRPPSRPAGPPPAQQQVQAAGAPAPRRVAPPGRDPMQSRPFQAFLAMLRSNSAEFEAQGRVLRLRQFLRADVPPRVLDAVLDALEANSRVQALYIQNFEAGMGDAQLDRLARLLRRRRIWALNVGENFGTSQAAWRRFCDALPGTAVAHLYVSEQHLAGTDLKGRMRDAIRANRRAAPPRDPEVIVHVGNMWWNPKLPPCGGSYSPRGATARAAAAAGSAAVVTVPLPAGASRESLSGGASGGGGASGNASAGSGAGGAQAEGGSAGRAGSAAGSAAAAATTSGVGAASQPGAAACAPPALGAAAGAGTAGSAEVAAAAAAAAQQQQGYSLRAAPKRRQGCDEDEFFGGSPPAKSGPAAAAFEAAGEAAAAPASAFAPAAAAAAAAMEEAGDAGGAAPGVGAGRAGSSRRAGRPSAARLLQQSSGLSSDEDEELDEAYLEEGDDDDAAYLPFKSGMLVASDPYAAPTRASRRIQRRSVQAYQGHLPMDDEFVTFDPEEAPSPPRAAAPRRRHPQQQLPAGLAAAQQQQRAAAARARVAAAAAQPPHSLPAGMLPTHSAGAASRSPAAAPGAARGGAAAPRAAATAAKRSLHSVAQRMRSSSGRQPSGELKGRPSFAELVESGFMAAGAYRFTVGMQDIHASLEPDGTIVYAGSRYRAISKFALVVLRERNPSRQSCDGWKEVTWNGEKLDLLRARFQSHQRKAAARKAAAAGPVALPAAAP